MFQGDQGTRGTLHKTGLYFMCIYTLICYFTYLNSPVFYGPTPIVPEGAEHRLGGLHPGAPSLASLPAAAWASPPAYCACRHWASRTRAVSLLTGGLIPQLALYLIKRNPPKRSIVKSISTFLSDLGAPASIGQIAGDLASI